MNARNGICITFICESFCHLIKIINYYKLGLSKVLRESLINCDTLEIIIIVTRLGCLREVSSVDENMFCQYRVALLQFR
jgi:hypothetical protein